MSNIQYQLYLQSIKRLAKTMVIKNTTVADEINARIVSMQGYTGVGVEDHRPETWKYYLNLAGRYHELDQLMQIVSLDTMETINFDRETLRHHRGTLREYRAGTRYYDELVARYPHQEGLIRGILNPVDIDRAIAAPDYSILWYDRNEVEGNETNLIPELQNWINTFIYRWETKDYRLTDSLYHPALMMQMYMYLPIAISVIRKENCKTYKAHSFHVWNYLESHGDLTQYRDFLTTRQRLWLYRNIKWVFANAGKEDTFGDLLREVLTNRGIPLGEYVVKNDVTDIADNIYSEPYLLRKPLNLFTSLAPDPIERSVRSVLEKQLPLARDNASILSEEIEDTTYELSRSLVPELMTKVYESEMIDLTDQQVVTIDEVLLQNWLFFSTNNRYLPIINIQNPYTSEIMTMSVRDAFTMWLYAVNKYNGITLPYVPKLAATRVRRIPLPSFEQLRGLAEKRLIDDETILSLLDDQVDIGTIISTEGFFDISSEIHSAMLRHRIVHNSFHHKDARAQMERIVRSCYQTIKCSLVPQEELPYGTFFEERGWFIEELERGDLQILIEDLYNTSTGLDIQVRRSLRDIQRAMLGLMSQLGTYSTHYIQTINSSPATVIDQIAVRVGDNDASGGHKQSVDVANLRVIDYYGKVKKSRRIETNDLCRFTVSVRVEKERLELDPTVDFKNGVIKRELIRVKLNPIDMVPMYDDGDRIANWDDVLVLDSVQSTPVELMN